MIPTWLHFLSVTILSLGFACAVIITADEWHHPQKMWIMNLVWPLTASFGTVAWLWFYFRVGRLSSKMVAEQPNNGIPQKSKSFAAMVAEASSHCGSGCTLGDICAEWLAFGFPAVAVWFGWQSIIAEKMFAVWLLDYLFAFAFGIVFQYFSIVPMRHRAWPKEYGRRSGPTRCPSPPGRSGCTALWRSRNLGYSATCLALS
jgi:hypothetical protein